MSPRNLAWALGPFSRAARLLTRRRRVRPAARRLGTEPLEPRAMLSTTATLGFDAAAFTRIPVTFRRPDGTVGLSTTASVGQLSWSAMTGAAATVGVPASFTSFCIEGLQGVAPGRNTFATIGPASGSPLLGADRADLLADFWRQYGPTDAAGFADKTDSAAFQLGVWELINDGRPVRNAATNPLAAGQFSVGATGLTTQAAVRARQWLDGLDSAAPGRTAVALYALHSPTRQDQVVAVPIVDLDVDGDNTGVVDRSAAEETAEKAGVTAATPQPTGPGLIVPVGGNRVQMVVDVPRGRTARLEFTADVATRARVWTNAGAEVLSGHTVATPIHGGDPSIFWIGAFAPSTNMADLVFTLTTSDGGPVSSDTIRGTAVAVDLDVDEVPAELEDIGAGAVVWRNSDFSRLLPHPDPAKRDVEPGLLRYAPDYTDRRTIDPEYARQFTLGRATFTPGLTDVLEFRFLFDSSKIALWTRESWVGFDKLTPGPDGWWNIPAGTSVHPGPGDSRERIEFWIEGLATTGYGKDKLELWTLPKPGPARPPVPPPDIVSFTVVDVGLGVDGNRDGTIDFADSHDRQLTFWLNDDGELVADPETPLQYETENPLYSPGSTNDSGDDRITTTRDLEDFATLHFLADENLQRMIQAAEGEPPVGIRPAYRYTLRIASADTRIRLFRDYHQAEPLAHVTDVPTARRLRGSFAAENAIGGDFTVLRSLERPGRDDRFRYLFEAFGNGGRATLEFTVTVSYPQSAGTSGQVRTTARTHTLDLDLRDIKDFYTRMSVPYRNGSQDARFEHFVPGTENLPHFGAAQPLFEGKTRDMPFLSGSDTAVLVHGWNMTDGTPARGPKTDSKRAFAETAVKRLYWQGFRGNVTAFDWPTFSDQEGELQGDLAFFNFSFNASEYQAFRSGRSLMTFLEEKKATGPVHLLAHSMGNVVAAEAMRLWAAAGNGQPLVNNYVAMQGALSAGAYGDDATDATGDYPSGYDHYRYWPDRWLGSERRYYMQGTEQAAGKWINMFNEVDRATSAELGWVGNNRMKPLGGDIWRVQPLTPLSDPIFITYRVDRPDVGGRLLRSFGPLGQRIEEIDLKEWLVAPGPGELPGPAAYEILAFVSQANAKPIGTKEVLFFDRNGTNIDISDLGLGEPYTRERPGHSFQFHFDAASTSQFWKRVVDETAIDTVRKPRNP